MISYFKKQENDSNPGEHREENCKAEKCASQQN